MKTFIIIFLGLILVDGYCQKPTLIRTIYSFKENDSLNIKIVSLSYLNQYLNEDSTFVFNNDSTISYREYFKYDKKGKLIFEESFDWPDKEDKEKIKYFYDKQNNLVKTKEMVKEKYRWVTTEVNINVFDTKNNVIKSFCLFDECYTNIYEYDSCNRKISEKILSGDVIKFHYKYEYFDGGYKRLEEHVQGNQDTTTTETIYMTDNRNRIIEELLYSNGVLVWKTQNIFDKDLLKKTIVYGKNNKLKSTSEYYYK